MPTYDTVQTQMDVHMGVSPAIEASSRQIDDISFRMNVVAKTADYTCLLRESGTMFTMVGAAADIEFTLPALTDGVVYWFYQATDYEMLISAAAADTMICFNDADADAIALTQADEHLGNCVMMVCDGTMWYCCLMLGAADATVVPTT